MMPLFEFAANLKPAGIWQINVECNQIKISFFDQQHPLFRSCCDFNFAPSARKQIHH